MFKNNGTARTCAGGKDPGGRSSVGGDYMGTAEMEEAIRGSGKAKPLEVQEEKAEQEGDKLEEMQAETKLVGEGEKMMTYEESEVLGSNFVEELFVRRKTDRSKLTRQQRRGERHHHHMDWKGPRTVTSQRGKWTGHWESLGQNCGICRKWTQHWLGL